MHANALAHTLSNLLANTQYRQQTNVRNELGRFGSVNTLL